MSLANSKYTLQRDDSDERDYIWNIHESLQLPTTVDLRPHFTFNVYDQGRLGSCTSQAIAAAIEYLNSSYAPSRLFIYYNERASQGTVSVDSGSSIRVGIKTTIQYGACPESEWPYIETNYYSKPTDQCYIDAKKDLVMSYYRVEGDVILGVKHAINAGFPVCFGITVYSSFESQSVAATGLVPMPSPSDSILGGHAVLIVGYDDTKQVFIVRNSWGANWGDKGYFYLPYNYAADKDLASDFWVITKV